MKKHKTGVSARLAPAALLAVTVLPASAACGSGGGGAGDKGGSASGCSAPAADANNADWQKVVDAAGTEGSVTLYTSQALAVFTNFTPCFQQAYPKIKLNVVRMLDNEAAAKIDAEYKTGKLTADAFVVTVKKTQDDMAKANRTTAASGPGFHASDFLPQYLHENGLYFEVGGTTATFAWNTSLAPQGLKDYPDLLDPALADGKIGLPDATLSPTFVDFYLYLTKNYGDDFLKKLAAQKPHIYPGGVPIVAGLQSGEIAASGYTKSVDFAKGAPVKAGKATVTWGSPFYGSVLAGSTHPNAAQVLVDFMVSRKGQELLTPGLSAVLPDIPEALTTNDKLPARDPRTLDPKFIAEFNTTWAALFQNK